MRKEYEAMLAEANGEEMAVDRRTKPRKDKAKEAKKLEFQANVIVRIDGIKEGTQNKDIKVRQIKQEVVSPIKSQYVS
jgi:hypothetical protein